MIYEFWRWSCGWEGVGVDSDTLLGFPVGRFTRTAVASTDALLSAEGPIMICSTKVS